MNQIAAYGGFPTRYPHWRFGMEYEQLSQGLRRTACPKIYEMVINNDPCYAYLLEATTLVDQKLVMAHVYGHCDFFKNNFWFAHTNRKMMDEMANHATRVRRYIEKLRRSTQVEDFIDLCLSLENLIDYHSPFISAQAPRRTPTRTRTTSDAREPLRMRAKDYMDEYINPPEFLEREARENGARSSAGEDAVPGATRSATCCCSCSSTRRWRTGSATCLGSSATRPTTSRRRARPRS